MSIWQTLLKGDGLSTDSAFEPDIPSGVIWAMISIDYENRLCVIDTDADLFDVPSCVLFSPPPIIEESVPDIV